MSRTLRACDSAVVGIASVGVVDTGGGAIGLWIAPMSLFGAPSSGRIGLGCGLGLGGTGLGGLGSGLGSGFCLRFCCFFFFAMLDATRYRLVLLVAAKFGAERAASR